VTPLISELLQLLSWFKVVNKTAHNQGSQIRQKAPIGRLLAA